MKPMQTRALRKLLKDLGCEQTSTEGSHEKWTAPGGHCTVLVAAEAEQKAGTLRNIQDDLAPELGARWLEKARAR